RHINEDCPDPRALVPEVSGGAADLIRAMTNRDRGLRLHPEEVVQRIDAILGRGTASIKSSSSARRPAVATRSSGHVKTTSSARQRTLASPPPKEAEKAPEEGRERQVVAALVVVGALIVAVAVGLLAHGGPHGDAAPVVTPDGDGAPKLPPP